MNPPDYERNGQWQGTAFFSCARACTPDNRSCVRWSSFSSFSGKPQPGHLDVSSDEISSEWPFPPLGKPTSGLCFWQCLCLSWLIEWIQRHLNGFLTNLYRFAIICHPEHLPFIRIPQCSADNENDRMAETGRAAACGMPIINGLDAPAMIICR